MEPTKMIKEFHEYLNKNHSVEIPEKSRVGEKFLLVDFPNLSMYSPELADELLENPEEVLKAGQIALEQFEVEGDIKNFTIMIKDLPKSNQVYIRDLRSKHLTKLWTVQGLIKRKSDVRPKVTSSRFECPSCGNVITVIQIEKKFREPTTCGCGRKGKFKILSTELVDAYSLVVEELTEYVKAGSELKRLNCFVKGPLTHPNLESKIFPGVKVKVYGILKPFYKETRGGKKETQLDIFFDINNIEVLETDYEDIEISPEDKEEFHELVKTGGVMDVLSRSMFSAVHGKDMIKNGMILLQVGGEQKILPSGYKSRGDIHGLLIGDPGTTKSMFLKLVCNFSPKSRFVSGKGASGVGLTAAVVKDELMGGFALEAGALPLTHHGLCAVDEFDKLAQTETDAIHEALEEQTISISKASIQATLKAETTLLAAANPKFGRFDRNEPLSRQIDLPPALFTRFDLIFLFLDKPDEKEDRAIAKKILSRHRTVSEPLMSAKKIKKFFAYTKQFHPTYSSKIEDEIVEFYTKIRNAPRKEGSTAVPISPRYIEVIRRLSEAHAKLNLRDKINIDDVQVAIDLVMYTLRELTLDPETGQLDVDMISTGYSAKGRSKHLRVMEVIKNLSDELNKFSHEELIKRIVNTGFSEVEAEEIVNKSLRNGELYEPNPGFYIAI